MLRYSKLITGISSCFLLAVAVSADVCAQGIDLVVSTRDQFLTSSEGNTLVCQKDGGKSDVWSRVSGFLSSRSSVEGDYWVLVNGRGAKLERGGVRYSRGKYCIPGLEKHHTLCTSLKRSACTGSSDSGGSTGNEAVQSTVIGWHRSTKKVNLNAKNTQLLDVMPGPHGDYKVTLEFSPSIERLVSVVTKDSLGHWVLFTIGGTSISSARIRGQLGGAYLFIGIETEQDVKDITAALSE